MDLTILTTTKNEADNILLLIPRLKSLFKKEGVQIEALVIDGDSTDGTASTARSLGCRVYAQSGPGYAQAIRDGIALAEGDFVIVMDADLSHDPEDALRLYQNRGLADIVINSRYMAGGGTEIAGWRSLLSSTLNALYRGVLCLPFREVSGGFRIYPRELLQRIPIESRFYEVQEELIIRAHWMGCSTAEIPYRYRRRHRGASKAHLVKYGAYLLMALLRLRLRRGEIKAGIGVHPGTA